MSIKKAKVGFAALVIAASSFVAKQRQASGAKA